MYRIFPSPDPYSGQHLAVCTPLKAGSSSWRQQAILQLNSLGERRKSFGEYINEDFQRKYAGTVIELSQINRDLNEYLKSIREFTQEVSKQFLIISLK